MVRAGAGPIVLCSFAGGVAAVLMMCCRTYLRAHWLTDTFEGVALASGIALVLWSLFTPALSRDRDRRIPLTPWSR